jgi:hypothetical protein
MASIKKEKASVAETSKPVPAAPAKVAAKKVAAQKAVVKKLAATPVTAKVAPAAAAATPSAKPKAAAKKVATAKARAKGPVEGPPVDQAQRANYIEVAAYYIAQRRGFTPGDPEQDYLDAAAEVDQLIAAGHFSR